MVGYMLAAALLPLVLAGHHQMTNEQMMYMMQMQQNQGNNMMQGNMLNAGQYQVDINGFMSVGNQMNQMNQGSHGNQNQAGAWWGMETAETWSLDELDGVDLTNVDAVAQRMATLSEGDQLKLYFHGLISGVCDGVKVYVDQVKQWEAQYNFMGF